MEKTQNNCGRKTETIAAIQKYIQIICASVQCETIQLHHDKILN